MKELILVVFNQGINSRLLQEFLEDRYSLLVPSKPSQEVFLEGEFSLGIVDGPVLQVWREAIEKRREKERPLFLPFMLVTSREDLGMAKNFLWAVVEEVLITPIEKLELWARIESLLTIRRLSRELHSQYRCLFEHIPLGLYRSSFSGTILDVNFALAKIMGFESSEEIIGKNALDFYLNPEDRKVWQGILQKRGVNQFRCWLKRRDGSTFWASLSIQGVYDSKGDFLYYEGSMEDVTRQVTYEEQLQIALGKLESDFEELVAAFSRLVEVKDAYVAGHQQRVALLARAIARLIGFLEERVQQVYVAGLLHDVGKITIPGDILNKPSHLTPLEWAFVKEHPQKGYEIIHCIELLCPVAEIILEHHERMDGSGYPRGLKGDNILKEARILAVADVVEAMAHHHPYRPPLGIEEALREIVAQRGVLYDREVVDACVCLFREKQFFWED
ncbi:MAG: HD domain-containing phosphohydrolase [Candidatus Caldatribacteriaceae bacterium]